MNFWIALFTQLLILFGLIYLYLYRKYSYWSSRGVPGPTPSIFKFGNMFQLLGGRLPATEVNMTKKYGKLYGHYNGVHPAITLADPELIKQISVKDFHLFVNRRELGTYHYLFNHNLFFAEDEEWKRIRAITTPSFSTGKLRKMRDLMNQCISKLTVYIDKLIDQGDGIIQTKEVMAGFTIDIITSTNFATETDANDDRENQNKSPIVKRGLSLFNINPFRALCFLGATPRWFNDLIGVRFGFAERDFMYFADLTRAIYKKRVADKGKTKRTDLIQLLMEASLDEGELKKMNYDALSMGMESKDDAKEEPNSVAAGQSNTKRGLTEDEVISQCIVFFLAGYETTASTITNAIFEMAHQPDIQERLAMELTRALGHLDVNSDEYYDTVMNGIVYLDAFLKETLRKYPPVVRFDRRNAVQGYQLGNITLDEGVHVELVPMAMHYNEEYFPEPHRFDPERFMPANRHLIVPYSYIPFGVGPRNCIGMRFAYQEIKLLLARIVREYRFLPTNDTPDVLVFKLFKPLLNVEPFPIRVERRI